MPALLDTYIENRERVQPNHANNYGTAHGGNVMKWMDEVGAMSAIRFAGNDCVTANVQGLDFKRPIPTGETAFIESYVYRAGRTSMHVHLCAYRENLRTDERRLTTESTFVFVAVDDDLQPTRVPELTVETDRGEELRRRAVDAEERTE